MTHALTLGQAALDRLMPMHLCIADCGQIHFAGPTMRKLMPPGAQGVEDIFVEARGIATGHVIGAIRAAEPGDRLALGMVGAQADADLDVALLDVGGTGAVRGKQDGADDG